MKNCAKRLAAIFKLVTEAIPTDPGAPKFRQGDTFDDDRKHWLRAKFFQQYRLFFRFDGAAKIIVLVWVNDEKSLRACGSRKDGYTTIEKMLDGGNPPDSFETLMKDAVTATTRFENSLATEKSDRIECVTHIGKKPLRHLGACPERHPSRVSSGLD